MAEQRAKALAARRTRARLGTSSLHGPSDMVALQAGQAARLEARRSELERAARVQREAAELERRQKLEEGYVSSECEFDNDSSSSGGGGEVNESIRESIHVFRK